MTPDLLILAVYLIGLPVGCRRNVDMEKQQMTYPFREDLTPKALNHLRRILDQAWEEANQTRMGTNPGSKQEAEWLEIQHAIETLQATL